MRAEGRATPQSSVRNPYLLASLFCEYRRLLRHHLLTVDAVAVECYKKSTPPLPSSVTSFSGFAIDVPFTC